MALAHTAAPVTPTSVFEAPLSYRPEKTGQEEPDTPVDPPLSSPMPDPAGAQIVRGQSAPLPAKTMRRWISLGSMLILLAALMTQLGVDAYGTLADSQPKLAGWLQTLCPPGRCALRQSNALSIDDSKLTSAGAKAFHLQAVIRNRSELTLEAPSLALTFTDSADDVLARKIYAPKDWAAPSDELQGGSTAPIDLWVQWDNSGSTARVAGYRLQLFYP